MAKYIIEGGRKLKGSVKISGNKNSILPALAATLLTDQEIILRNAPQISDVTTMLSLLNHLGVKVNQTDNILVLKRSSLKTHILPSDLTGSLRASILLVGPLLATQSRVKFSHPGGDIIGKRSIKPHILSFEKLGYKFKQNDREYEGESTKKDYQNSIFLNESSVTATENLLLSAALGNYNITIKNCAQEPHVVDLCNLLNLMGARITGVGTSTLFVQGAAKLKGADFTISPEHIEIGTYAVAAALTHGVVKMTNCTLENLEPIILPLQEMGITLESTKEGVVAHSEKIVAIPRLVVRPWPGFPTDLMSVFIVLATQAEGVSLLHDWMFESRMFFADKLISMGANITIADPHRVLVYGPTSLYGRELETPDIRAGMALVLAALIAKGRSVVNRAELIERGYEDVVGNLTKLGAKIKKES